MFNKYIIIICVALSCSPDVNYKDFISKYENENVKFSKNTHIIYRGKDVYENNLFAYYQKGNDSLATILKILYKNNNTIEILDKPLSNRIIDIYKIKEELDLFLKLKIKSLNVSDLGCIKINLDDDDHFDLIWVSNPSLLNDNQKLNFLWVKENWYLIK